MTDNGLEFVSVALATRAEGRSVELDFIEPAKLIQNCFAESFNGTFRDERLNEHWFASLEDARNNIETWRRRPSQERSHSSRGGLTPFEFASRLRQEVVGGSARPMRNRYASNQSLAEAPVIQLVVIVIEVLSHNPEKVTLIDRDDLRQAF